MPIAKPVPTITWENMNPPDTDYEYFQNSSDFPFEWEARGFSLTNAWWLAETALLAYADEAFARPRFETAGFNRVRFFNGRSTQCYLLGCDSFSVLAFRGTESKIQKDINAFNQFIADLKTDFDFRLVDSRDAGKIHNGFNKALDEVWDEILPHLDSAASRPLWMTGHSLGGALATLAAARRQKVPGLYTYGSPRVGDKVFRRRFRIPAFRFVNHTDMVTKIPPRPYRHIGRLYQLDSRGRLRPVSAKTTFIKALRSRIADMITALHTRGIAKTNAMITIPQGLKDHTLLLYALHIWNNLVGAY